MTKVIIGKIRRKALQRWGRFRAASKLLEPRLLRDLYLDLIQDCLTGTIYQDPPINVNDLKEFDPTLREYGWDWPSVAHSMIGSRRMSNIRELAEQVLANSVPGDFMETGVWRGGACIYMRAILKAYGVTDRRVWVTDSFEGLPPPDESKYPADVGDEFHTYDQLAVSIDTVKENFSRYGLLDEQVVFLKGWFRDTLPSAPVTQLALLRLDGDMYESTMDALTSLYHKVARHGFVIIDDYRVVKGCKDAVDGFRNANSIRDPIEEIDNVGVYWQKSGRGEI